MATCTYNNLNHQAGSPKKRLLSANTLNLETTVQRLDRAFRLRFTDSGDKQGLLEGSPTPVSTQTGRKSSVGRPSTLLYSLILECIGRRRWGDIRRTRVRAGELQLLSGGSTAAVLQCYRHVARGSLRVLWDSWSQILPAP